jgi:hypothetical protein
MVSNIVQALVGLDFLFTKGEIMSVENAPEVPPCALEQAAKTTTCERCGARLIVGKGVRIDLRGLSKDAPTVACPDITNILEQIGAQPTIKKT